jgi:hypothetical protein
MGEKVVWDNTNLKRFCNIVLMTKFDKTLLYRIYPIKLDIFIGFYNLDIGSWLNISDLGRTYLMYQTYPTSSRVPEP